MYYLDATVPTPPAPTHEEKEKKRSFFLMREERSKFLMDFSLGQRFPKVLLLAAAGRK